MSPVKCPPDAFCPGGSVEPTYCMELFLYKAGDSCQLTPATIIVLATLSAGESGSSVPRHPLQLCAKPSVLWVFSQAFCVSANLDF